MRIYLFIVAAAILVLAACDRAPTTQNPVAQGPQVEVSIVVVDVDGQPLSGMQPIATLQPNAFDTPIARGAPTEIEGRGTIMVPANKRVFVRAWDPALRYFANNYLEVLPSSGGTTDTFKVQMVRGGALAATVYYDTGELVVGTPVSLMLSHPTHGPWWPDEATPDSRGRVVFRSVPPGEFTARIEVPGKGSIELPNVTVIPGGNTEMGALQLFPAPSRGRRVP